MRSQGLSVYMALTETPTAVFARDRSGHTRCSSAPAPPGVRYIAVAGGTCSPHSDEVVQARE